MRQMTIQFQGDDWDNEEEAEALEDEVQQALDKAGVDYVDVFVD